MSDNVPTTFFSLKSTPNNWALTKAVAAENEKRNCAARSIIPISVVLCPASAFKNLICVIVKLSVAIFALTIGQIPAVNQKVWNKLEMNCLVGATAGQTLIDLFLHVYNVVMYATVSPVCCLFVAPFVSPTKFMSGQSKILTISATPENKNAEPEKEGNSKDPAKPNETTTTKPNDKKTAIGNETVDGTAKPITKDVEQKPKPNTKNGTVEQPSGKTPSKIEGNDKGTGESSPDKTNKEIPKDTVVTTPNPIKKVPSKEGALQLNNQPETSQEGDNSSTTLDSESSSANQTKDEETEVVDSNVPPYTVAELSKRGRRGQTLLRKQILVPGSLRRHVEENEKNIHEAERKQKGPEGFNSALVTKAMQKDSSDTTSEPTSDDDDWNDSPKAKKKVVSKPSAAPSKPATIDENADKNNAQSNDNKENQDSATQDGTNAQSSLSLAQKNMQGAYSGITKNRRVHEPIPTMHRSDAELFQEMVHEQKANITPAILQESNKQQAKPAQTSQTTTGTQRSSTTQSRRPVQQQTAQKPTASPQQQVNRPTTQQSPQQKPATPTQPNQWKLQADADKARLAAEKKAKQESEARRVAEETERRQQSQAIVSGSFFNPPTTRPASPPPVSVTAPTTVAIAATAETPTVDAPASHMTPMLPVKINRSNSTSTTAEEVQPVATSQLGTSQMSQSQEEAKTPADTTSGNGNETNTTTPAIVESQNHLVFGSTAEATPNSNENQPTVSVSAPEAAPAQSPEAQQQTTEKPKEQAPSNVSSNVTSPKQTPKKRDLSKVPEGYTGTQDDWNKLSNTKKKSLLKDLRNSTKAT